MRECGLKPCHHMFTSEKTIIILLFVDVYCSEYIVVYVNALIADIIVRQWTLSRKMVEYDGT